MYLSKRSISFQLLQCFSIKIQFYYTQYISIFVWNEHIHCNDFPVISGENFNELVRFMNLEKLWRIHYPFFLMLPLVCPLWLSLALIPSSFHFGCNFGSSTFLLLYSFFWAKWNGWWMYVHCHQRYENLKIREKQDRLHIHICRRLLVNRSFCSS